MFRIRGAITIAALTAIVGTALAVAAPPASALEDRCILSVMEVTARDLQEDGQGRDEVWVRVGPDGFFPSTYQSITFTKGQKRFASELNNPGISFDVLATQEVGLLEDDTWPDANDPLGSFRIGCAGLLPGQIGGGPQTIEDGDADYIVVFSVMRVQQ